jgi:hypothetical protein
MPRTACVLGNRGHPDNAVVEKRTALLPWPQVVRGQQLLTRLQWQRSAQPGVVSFLFADLRLGDLP